jgi:hypothetical protein
MEHEMHCDQQSIMISLINEGPEVCLEASATLGPPFSCLVVSRRIMDGYFRPLRPGGNAGLLRLRRWNEAVPRSN